jgi:hypothetical protein
VLQRLIALAALVAVLVVPGGALAANVQIRVEGKTTTIYGSAQPRVAADNALQALDLASVAGEFHYAVATAAFGTYVSQIGKYAAAGTSGWVFKVNGVTPQVGADQVTLKDGDVVLWYHATFGPAGGPPTLDLQRLPGNCYVVQAVDDAGKRTRAANAAIVADGKRTNARNGRACIGRHVGLVRAVAAGAVRSNAVR